MKISMKTSGFGVAAVVGLATCLSVGTARADVFIGWANIPSDPIITQLATGANSASFSESPTTDFTTLLAGGLTPPGAGLLNSNLQVTVAPTPGTTSNLIFVTATGLTTPLPADVPLITGFTSNGQSVASTSMLVYIDPDNRSFMGLGVADLLNLVQLASFGESTGTETSMGLLPGEPPAVGAGPYSVIEEFDVSNTPDGSANLTIDVAAVPGPIVGAGLPGLIAALGGLVAMARRRRRQLA